MVSDQLQPGEMDEWLAIIRESIVPSLEEQDGIVRFVALIDRKHDKSISYCIWDSVADLAASETSGNYPQQIAKLGSVLAAPAVREVHEVIVVA